MVYHIVIYIYSFFSVYCYIWIQFNTLYRYTCMQCCSVYRYIWILLRTVHCYKWLECCSVYRYIWIEFITMYQYIWIQYSTVEKVSKVQYSSVCSEHFQICVVRYFMIHKTSVNCKQFTKCTLYTVVYFSSAVNLSNNKTRWVTGFLTQGKSDTKFWAESFSWGSYNNFWTAFLSSVTCTDDLLY